MQQRRDVLDEAFARLFEKAKKGVSHRTSQCEHCRPSSMDTDNLEFEYKTVVKRSGTEELLHLLARANMNHCLVQTVKLSIQYMLGQRREVAKERGACLNKKP